jgi:hypothetical protein
MKHYNNFRSEGEGTRGKTGVGREEGHASKVSRESCVFKTTLNENLMVTDERRCIF